MSIWDIYALVDAGFAGADLADAGQQLVEMIHHPAAALAPLVVEEDQAYQNAMKNSSKSAARLEHDRALEKVVIGMLSDHTELFKQFSDNPGFKKWPGSIPGNTR